MSSTGGWSKQRTALALAAVAVCVVLGAWLAPRLNRRADIQVTTVPVTAGPIVRRIIASGTLQAVTTVTVGAQVSGTIQSLGVDFNSIVHKGQVVAKLDPALLNAQLGQAQASLEQGRAALEQAKANVVGFKTAVEAARLTLTRDEALAAHQLMTQADLDAARIAMDEANADEKSGEALITSAEAQIAQSQAAVDQAQTNVDHTIIQSPIDGIVVNRSVDVGQTVASSMTAPVLFSIAADLRQMQVEVDLDEADVGGVNPGEPTTFEVQSFPDLVFEGTVKEVRLNPVTVQTSAAAPVGTPGASGVTTAAATVTTYATIITVANPDQLLRPGMTATVTLGGTRLDNAIRIPSAALSFRPSPDVLKAIGETVEVQRSGTSVSDESKPRQVWRYDGQRFTPVDVHTGLADAQWTELVSGSLRPGDTVVTNATLPRKTR